MVRWGGEVIEWFLHWLAPYSETEGFVGYTRCDEVPERVDLIYFESGEVYYKSIEMWEDPPHVSRRKLTPRFFK